MNLSTVANHGWITNNGTLFSEVPKSALISGLGLGLSPLPVSTDKASAALLPAAAVQITLREALAGHSHGGANQ